MPALKPSSLLLIIGSLVFLSASFATNPQVYMEPSPAVRLAVIHEARTIWITVNFFYAAGALLSAIAVVGILRSIPRRSPLPLLLGAAALIGGAIFFLLYASLRVSSPEIWVQVPPPHPLFLAYTLLTQAGLLVFGAALMQAKTFTRLAWLIIGASLLLFILTLIIRDMPPLAYYLLLLAAGIGLFRRSRQEKTMLSEVA
jgi:hypothetical protein